jgi:flagellar protein FlaF
MSNKTYNALPGPGVPAYSEAWALIEAARRMAESVDAPEGVAAMRDSLRLNWRLWTIFQASLSTEESGVPDDVRSNMLSLCQFVDKYTVEALVGPTARHVETLVNINRNIASGLLAGLQAQAGAEAAQAADAPAPGARLDASVA